MPYLTIEELWEEEKHRCMFGKIKYEEIFGEKIKVK